MTSHVRKLALVSSLRCSRCVFSFFPISVDCFMFDGKVQDCQSTFHWSQMMIVLVFASLKMSEWWRTFRLQIFLLSLFQLVFLSLIIYLSCRAFWENEEKLKIIGLFFNLCHVFLHSCSVKHWWLLILPYISVSVFNLAGWLVLWDGTHYFGSLWLTALRSCVKEFHTWLLYLEPQILLYWNFKTINCCLCHTSNSNNQRLVWSK